MLPTPGWRTVAHFRGGPGKANASGNPNREGRLPGREPMPLLFKIMLLFLGIKRGQQQVGTNIQTRQCVKHPETRQKQFGCAETS